ncbi:uncharacterized protein LOC142612192 [Castanea sativa]|uniref:uncharacterized protein LOC142612192 n=1 Tax=Castanea sativa TaxID=21020 RepID=UPI003F64E2B4
MPGIDIDIVQLYIPIDPTMKLVKQKLRRMKSEWTLKIKEEVEKLYNVGFLRVANYPEWLANVGSGIKEGWKGHALLSFMRGFSSTIKSRWLQKIWRKTLSLHRGETYCYEVMPFGLKKTSATYQRAATTLLHDLFHKEVEVYVDDMIVKSKDCEGHMLALRKFFERIQFYKL